MTSSTMAYPVAAAAAFAATFASAEEPTGKDIVTGLLTAGVQSCIADALRETVGDPDAEIQGKVTEETNGDYSQSFNAFSLGSDFVSKAADVGFVASADSLRWIITTVGSENVFEPESEAALSVSGMTAHYNNAASEEMAAFTRDAEVALNNSVYQCVYGVGHGNYPTSTMTPITPG